MSPQFQPAYTLRLHGAKWEIVNTKGEVLFSSDSIADASTELVRLDNQRKGR